MLPARSEPSAGHGRTASILPGSGIRVGTTIMSSKEHRPNSAADERPTSNKLRFGHSSLAVDILQSA